MSKHHDSSRRSFLGATAGLGASLLLCRDETPGDAQLGFSQATARPLAPMRCVLHPGPMQPGTDVHLKLTLMGPHCDTPQLIAEQRTVLTSDSLVWPVHLAYDHPRLVAGKYTYLATADVGNKQLVSQPVEYILRPFRFGV